ncbi:MAG TPA: hypothetical protein VGN23_08045 [Verrucomicrobiae bacterium]
MFGNIEIIDAPTLIPASDEVVMVPSVNDRPAPSRAFFVSGKHFTFTHSCLNHSMRSVQIFLSNGGGGKSPSKTGVSLGIPQIISVIPYFTHVYPCLLIFTVKIKNSLSRQIRLNPTQSNQFQETGDSGLVYKNEKTKPNYFWPFLITTTSSITTNKTHTLKMSPQKRSQIRAGEEEVRMQNEEKNRLLAIISVHSHELAVRLCAFVPLRLCVKTSESDPVQVNPTKSNQSPVLSVTSCSTGLKPFDTN